MIKKRTAPTTTAKGIRTASLLRVSIRLNLGVCINGLGTFTDFELTFAALGVVEGETLGTLGVTFGVISETYKKKTEG